MFKVKEVEATVARNMTVYHQAHNIWKTLLHAVLK
jgi:hypothetical protein